ncbi:dephospho-CoA kinase [Vibrio sp. TH_r3]|uniref:dephospho-CoA kinase n=1 Tax=Vibrio sp. TH_r3 TaxID=3082084 RepID=UPI002954A2FE|nr:dephospho-CoA kinase [Vibrio sp. TH_r3]MDV7104465.1 dephospho-CoA kinase [Vibrio sp. TH_r3]
MGYIVGLTGGIASGKTTVANLFHQHFNIGIVDADVVARKIVQPETEGLKGIVRHFGAEILQQNGELDRVKLREIIFSDNDAKTWLNSHLHPLIRQKMQQDINEITSPYALLVVPLLVENQLQSMANRILVVDVNPDVQLSRTVKRDNVSKTQAEMILATQASREQRLKYADDVIVNNDENCNLLPMVTKLHQQYMQLTINY